MKRAALMLALALSAGCSHTRMTVDSTTGRPGSSVQVHVESGNDLITLLGLSIVAAGMVEMERERTGGYTRAGIPLSFRDAPPLAPDRTVSEHDCTQPLDGFSGNLRCR